MTLSSAILLACILTCVVSLLGGAIPLIWRPSHRWLQVLLSFVAGVMAGIAAMDLIPHAVEAMSAQAEVHGHGHHHHHGSGDVSALRTVILWVIGGFLSMYLLERFVCFHHHEPDETTCEHQNHALSWGGATAGLSIHAILAGLGLGASILLESGQGVPWPGLALLIGIVMHKPFDGLAIVSLMQRDGRPTGIVWLSNLVYACVTPLGILMAWGWAGGVADPSWSGPAVAVTAGILLCIALADLLPELQTHSHDRMLLSLALVAGLGLACVATYLH